MTSPMGQTVGRQITPIECQCGGQFREFTPPCLIDGMERRLKEYKCSVCGRCIGFYEGIWYSD